MSKKKQILQDVVILLFTVPQIVALFYFWVLAARDPSDCGGPTMAGCDEGMVGVLGSIFGIAYLLALCLFAYVCTRSLVRHLRKASKSSQ